MNITSLFLLKKLIYQISNVIQSTSVNSPYSTVATLKSTHNPYCNGTVTVARVTSPSPFVINKISLSVSATSEAG